MYYGSVAAVRGVDLEAHDGECVGILGPNGAGRRHSSAPSRASCHTRERSPLRVDLSEAYRKMLCAKASDTCSKDDISFRS